MTEREAFKIGFMARCAESGLAPDGAEAVASFLVKRADFNPFGAAWEAARAVAGYGADALSRAAVAAPLVLWPTAFVGGHYLGKSLASGGPDKWDPKIEKLRELTYAYEDAAREMEDHAEVARRARRREDEDFESAGRRERFGR